jgi:hypothetical protein
MPLNATTSLPLPRTDPETMRTTGGSEAAALPDRATAAHATPASLSIHRIAILRRALELDEDARAKSVSSVNSTLIAADRFRVLSVARYTSPIPPAPICAVIS